MSAGKPGAGRSAAAVVGLVLAVLAAAPGAWAAEALDPEASERVLERVTVDLQHEVDLLEGLGLGAPPAGAEAARELLSQLADVQARVWRLRVAVAETVGGWLGPAAGRMAVGARPLALSPAVDLAVSDAAGLGRLRPLFDDWAGYRRVLARVSALQGALTAEAGAAAAGLPAPGRTCPVLGEVRFDHTWGEERPWGRTHKGEDLHAARNTPLAAMESGTIVQAGWHWSGGFGVYLEGFYSGDVYYYAHMAWTAPGIRPGAVVEVGELLGWVGSTGNADSPHLHLGWIPDNAGRWVDLEGLADPYPLLVGLCGPG